MMQKAWRGEFVQRLLPSTGGDSTNSFCVKGKGSYLRPIEATCGTSCTRFYPLLYLEVSCTKAATRPAHVTCKLHVVADIAKNLKRERCCNTLSLRWGRSKEKSFWNREETHEALRLSFWGRCLRAKLSRWVPAVYHSPSARPRNPSCTEMLMQEITSLTSPKTSRRVSQRTVVDALTSMSPEALWAWNSQRKTEESCQNHQKSVCNFYGFYSLSVRASWTRGPERLFSRFFRVWPWRAKDCCTLASNHIEASSHTATVSLCQASATVHHCTFSGPERCLKHTAQRPLIDGGALLMHCSPPIEGYPSHDPWLKCVLWG